MDAANERDSLQLRSRAWALVDQGICSENPVERVRLGHQALQIFEGCSGAYLLLAEGNIHSDPDEAVSLCQRAVEAAKTSMGFAVEHVKEAAPGEFFHIPASRRYVEALVALSHSLYAAGRRPEATANAFEVLELDSSDHLGVSHALIEWLMEDSRDEDAFDVLELLPCPCAHHAYSRALLSLRTFGERDRRPAWALKLALENNPAVAAYLLGSRGIPPDAESARGDQLFEREVEAARYAARSARLWASSPGALDWLETLSSDPDLLEEKISPVPRGSYHCEEAAGGE